MVLLNNFPIISFEQISLVKEQINKCICKVKGGTGFFCFIPYKNKKFPVLITNNHVFNEEFLKSNETISLELNNENKEKNINIKDKRIIFTNKEFDITIIEINPDKDCIYNFLELDEEIIKIDNSDYIRDRRIYVLQSDKRVSFGSIKHLELGESKMRYYCSTDQFSSGSPIMDLSKGKIIGIHVGGAKNLNYNIGTFLKYPIEEYINKFKDYINSKEKIISITYSIGIESMISKKEENILDFENKYKIIENELRLEKEKNKILEEKIIQLQKLLDNSDKNNIISKELSKEILKKDKEIEELKLKLLEAKNEKCKEFFSPFYEIEEKKRMQKLKREILAKEKKKRNLNAEKKGDKEINNVLENMCIYGAILKKEIEEEKQKNPEKFIPIEEALKTEENDQELFALALIANELKKIGVEAVIEKYENEEEEDEEEEGLTCLNFLLNGLNNKIKKYDLYFDFGEKKNYELLTNEKEFMIFKEKLKVKLSKEYKISVDKIIITFPQRGSLHVQLIFQSEEFNDLNLEEFRNRFNNDPEYDELNYLKSIHRDLLIEQCKLSKKYLDPEGNRVDGWGIDEERGNKEYYPPLNWIGIGINVIDKYDNGDNEWIGMDNTEREWCVAYHGLCRDKNTEEVIRITGNIVKGDQLRGGENQAYKSDDDENHPGKKVGIGVYVTPKIEIAKEYAGISEINGVEYYTVLMVRVNPISIRYSKEERDYWVLDSDQIRPYRILYKSVHN